MAATLTPIELLTQEIGILSEKRKSLEAAIKANEARLKDIRSEFDLESIKVKRDLDNLAAETAKQKAAMLGQLDPLKGEISGLRAQVTAEMARLESVKAERLVVTDARVKDVARLDAELKKKQDAIASVTADLKSLKAKVSAL
jgi:chromosome segregation ATPase